MLAAAGSEAQKDQWLRPVASGEAILTPAWLEPENGFSPRGVETACGGRRCRVSG